MFLFAIHVIHAQNNMVSRQLIHDNFYALQTQYGAYDLDSVKTNNTLANDGIQIITAKITSNSQKNYVLLIDAHNPSKPMVNKGIADVNFSNLSTSSDSNQQNGFTTFTSIDEGTILKIEFINGQKVITETPISDKAFQNKNKGNTTNQYASFAIYKSPLVKSNLYVSPILSCFKRYLQNSSWGELIIYAAYFPESMLAVLAGCAIDIYVIH